MWTDKDREKYKADGRRYPSDPCHLSVQKHTPELGQWPARLHQLDDAAEPSGEPTGSAHKRLLQNSQSLN